MLMVGSLVVPALLLAYAAWAMWNATYAAADDRIVRSLDVLHEQTLKVLKTGELVLDEITHDVQDLSDEQIRAVEPQLHARLRHIADMLPQLQSIWILDHDGFVLVSSRVSRRPRRPRRSHWPIAISSRGKSRKTPESISAPR